MKHELSARAARLNKCAGAEEVADVALSPQESRDFFAGAAISFFFQRVNIVCA
jgi:hypothetical protein